MPTLRKKFLKMRAITLRGMEVILGSGPTPKSRMSANNGSPDLGAWGGSAKAGDTIELFDIRDAARKRFTDSDE